METIRIDVKGKIARGDGQKIVCDNRSYRVEFSFSEEWDKYPIKTLCVKYNGTKYEEPFGGNIVPLPKILNAVSVEIGVYAEDMEVSTPAYFDCVKSIKSGNAVHVDPPRDVYDELARLANETREIAQSVKDDANSGVFDGKDGVDGKPGADGKDGKDGKDGQDGYTPVKGVDYFTAADKAEIVAAVQESGNEGTEVYIDIPNATGVESYYLALGENNSLVITTDPDEALDVYVEIFGTKADGSVDEFAIYSMIDDVKMYYNIDITDPNHPACSFGTTALTTYNYLEGIISYIVGDPNAGNAVGYSLSVWDSTVLGDIREIKIEDISTYSSDFIAKDTNEVTTSPVEDTSYRFGILYGYPEADIKLTGDVRKNGEYVLAVSNTASAEPVVITGLATPTNDDDAANKGYVDKAIANAGTGTGTGSGQPGADGKTAYEYAVEGGYTGTEAEFAAKMAKDFKTITQAEYDALETPDTNTYYFIKGDSDVSE